MGRTDEGRAWNDALHALRGAERVLQENPDINLLLEFGLLAWGKRALDGKNLSRCFRA
jgi:hypothetical protein